MGSHRARGARDRATDGFPRRVGAIDAGTNAIRFQAAEFVDATHWVELEYRRVPVRLGHNAFLNGRLDEDIMAAAVEALSAFRRAIDDLGLTGCRAVATSAVRESRNGAELVERVRRECGISLETITGSEECRLVWMALRTRVDLGERRWVLIDLGGGSLEVALVSAAGVHWSESHALGTVRLLEDLRGSVYTDPDRLRELVADYGAAAALQLPGSTPSPPPAGIIATGGNIEALAELAGRRPDDRGVSGLPLDTLRWWIDTLSTMSVDERRDHLGLAEDRADVILLAAVLYERVALLGGADAIVVPHVGVKEGVLLDLVEPPP